MKSKKQHKPHASNHRNDSNSMFIRPSAGQIAKMNRESPNRKVTNADFDPEVKLNQYGEPAFIQPNNTVQARMKMGQADDQYEQEADTIADKVVNKKNTGESSFQASPDIQTKPQPTPVTHPEVQKQEQQETEIQEKPIADSITPLIQRKEVEDESIQKMEDEQDIQMQKSDGDSASSNIESQLNSSKGKGSKMEASTKSQMESGFGRDFNNVNIHTDSNAVQMNENLGAQAFTNGSDVYFNEGKYNPSSKEGKHLLAHELTHTVQQGTKGDQVQRKEEKSIYTTTKEVINLLSGYTSDASSESIVNKFRWRSASDVRKLMVELKSGKHSSTKGNQMVLWLMSDLTDDHRKEMTRILLRSNAYSGKWYVAHMVIEYISGYTSDSNSATIIDYFYAMNIFDVIKVMEVMQSILSKNKEDTEAYLLADLTEEDQNKIKDLLDIRSKSPKSPNISKNGFDTFIVGTSYNLSAFAIQIGQGEGDSKASITIALRSSKMYTPDLTDVSKRKMNLEIDETKTRTPKIIRETEYENGDSKTKLLQLEIIPNDESSRVSISIVHSKVWTKVPFPKGAFGYWKPMFVEDGNMQVSHNSNLLNFNFPVNVPGSMWSSTVSTKPRQHPALGYVYDDKTNGKAYLYPKGVPSYDPKPLISAVIYSIPIIGSLVMIGEAIVGRDIWGRELSTTERALLAAGALLSALGPVIRASKSTVATVKTTNQVAKVANISRLEALGYVRGMKALTPSERAALTRYSAKIEGGGKLLQKETKSFERILKKVTTAKMGTTGLKNGHLAGKLHPKTGVPFTKKGFPNFKDFLFKGGKADIKIKPTGNRASDFDAANKIAGYSSTPKGYTWHHHQSKGRMQLVNSSVHSKTGHTGGFSLW